MTKEKKKWYFRWWAITIWIILGLSFISSLFEEESLETTKVSELTSEKSSEITKQESGKIIKIFEGDTIGGFDIWEDKIVFFGSGKEYDWALYLYDISTNELKRITYDRSSKRTPLIYKDLIFWHDERFSGDIFMYNLSLEKEVRFLEGLSLSDNYEDTLYVLDGMDGKWYLYYPDEDKFKELPNEFKDMDYYSMYDNKLVFTKLDHITRTFNIFYYDVLTDKIIQITNNTLDEKEPNIYKNKIVWSDNRNGKDNFDIYLYDLDTKKEIQITSQQNTNEISPLIYRNYIVYIKYGKERSIHLYDIKTKEDKKIPVKAGLIGKNRLKIYNNKVVWSICKDNRCVDKELYLYII